jgi:hypothetical protein
MLTCAPTASVGDANPMGLSKERLSCDYLKHFIGGERPCKEDQVLLILDNRESLLSILVINVAK